MSVSNVDLETSPQANNNGSPVVNNKASTSVDANNDGAEEKFDLASLFAADDSDSESDAEDDPSKPVDTIERLTKRLKLTPEQVYAIRVPMADGTEPLTIGALKDRVGEVVNLERREMEFNQRRVKQEGEVLRLQNETTDLLNSLPKNAITPELVKKVRDQRQKILDVERAKTLEVIPEWEDNEVRTKDLTDIIKYLSDNYGFSDSFITTVQDHRAIKFIRDSVKMQLRIQAALAKVKDATGKKPQRPSGKIPGKHSTPNATPKRKGVMTEQDRLMGILNGNS